jgi:hypothetical protein
MFLKNKHVSQSRTHSHNVHVRIFKAREKNPLRDLEQDKERPQVAPLRKTLDVQFLLRLIEIFI